MDYSNERYVRVYTRDTLTWRRLGWEGQAVLVLVLRKLDRTGVLEIEDLPPADAVSALTGVPLEVCERAVPMLLKLGVFEHVDSNLVAPKFIEAQEASMTPAARQKEHRLRRRDQIRGGLDPSQRETAIYFVQSEHGGEIKIGRADDVAKRLAGLSTGRPDKLVLLAAAPGTLAQERQLHERFAAHRVKGEWFSPCDDLMALVADVSERSSEAFEVLSQNVTCHESLPVTAFQEGAKAFAVTPSRAVPSMPSVPCRAEPSESARAREDWVVGLSWYCALLLGGDTTQAPDVDKWRADYAKLGRKPAAERTAAAATAAADPFVSQNRKALDPGHFVKHWARYVAGGRKAAPPAQSAAEESAARREAAGASKVAQLKQEYARQIREAQAGGDGYTADRLAAERDMRIAHIEARAAS